MASNPDIVEIPAPQFHAPSAQALSRVGVIDVGSNSVRLVVFDGAARSPAYFFNEKVMCGLGAGMSATGRLNPQGRVRALAAIRRFHHLAQTLGLPALQSVATAAVRDAADGPEFCDDVERETGLRLNVIPGEEEARLSAQGVLLGWPGAYGLVCDIGGSSMELAEISAGHVGRRVTSDLGPLKLMDIKGGKRGRAKVIDKTLKDLAARMGSQRDRLFLVGGSWRAIARIDMHRRNYPLHVLHEYRMSARDVSRTVEYIRKCDLDQVRGECGISSSRMDLVPFAAEVLKRLVRTFKPRDIAVSSYGIREGMLYEQMPTEVRDCDPLIEACHYSEAKDARLPGFGKVLFEFIQPLFKSVRPERMRIIQAACLLHDVTWRAHPDFRADVCFETATRANLGGLTHSERIYIGLALMHRYSNTRAGSVHEHLFDMIPPEDQKSAEILGKAMRFGAMLMMRTDTSLGKMKFYPKKLVLELRLGADVAPLFGERAEDRFQSLASSLGAETKVKIAAR